MSSPAAQLPKDDSQFRLVLPEVAREVEIDKLLRAIVQQRASDLHLNPGVPPTLRKDTKLLRLKLPPLTAEEATKISQAIVPNEHLVRLREHGSADFAIEFEGTRFRFNVSGTKDGLKFSIRRLPSQIMTWQEIDLPKQFVALTDRARGLVLVTGPTGSGKTTTLASLTKRILEKGNKHVYSLEAPTEYAHKHGLGLISQREVGIHCHSFEDGIHHALRSDPDVIVIGEMREKAVMLAALSAAETGHLVMATLHTTSAARTVNRIVESFADRDEIRAQLSTSLIGVLCQQLVPRNAEEGGLVGAFEFLAVTPAVAHKIRKGDIHTIDSDIQTGNKFGMQLLDEHLARLVMLKTITLNSAMEKANDPHGLEERVHRLQRHGHDDDD